MYKFIIVLCLIKSVVNHENDIQKNPKVCIIGAGVSGLSVSYYLQKAGLKEFDVYEQADNVGGTWKYDPRIGLDENGSPIHTSMYKSLRTNLPRHTMEFPDFPMPTEYSTFPTAKCFYNYIQAFADRFKLRKYIRFRSEVVSVKKVENYWKVQYKSVNGSILEKKYDFIMVCNGHNFHPNWPDNIDEVRRNFTGEITHAHHYREPEIFKDKKVLIVGAGPSGLDIGVDVSSLADKLIHSHHSKTVFESPFPSNYFMKPDIKMVNGTNVTFTDDSSEDVDVIIFCTGYHYYFPFLDETSKLQLALQYLAPLYKNTVNVNEPTMIFFGLGVHGIVTTAIHVQARYAASLVMGNFSLPSTQNMMETWEKQANSLKSNKKHLKLLHDLNPGETEYYDGLTEEAGIPRSPPVLVLMGRVATAAKVKNWYTFRSYHYTLLNDTVFNVNYRSEEVPCDVDKLRNH